MNKLTINKSIIYVNGNILIEVLLERQKSFNFIMQVSYQYR
jgi:hypothetical protein